MERIFKHKRAADAFRDRLKREGYYASTFEEPIDPHGSTRRARNRKRYVVQYDKGSSLMNPSKRSVRKRIAAALKKYVRGNPSVKGRKVKGGRSVTLKNFTGTIVKKSDGTVDILGRGRR